jgi:hypothetical protein
MNPAEGALWPLVVGPARTRRAAHAAELYVHLGSSRSPRLAPPPSPLLAHSGRPRIGATGRSQAVASAWSASTPERPVCPPGAG